MHREVPERWVLFTRHVLSSPVDIGVHARQDEPQLRTLASKHGLKIDGPLEHAYWDMTVKGVPHIMEVRLPVRPAEDGRRIDELKRVENYRCLTTEFRRPIEEIGNGWMELRERAMSLGHRLTNHDCEVYGTMDCDRPENNDIELQIGIE